MTTQETKKMEQHLCTAEERELWKAVYLAWCQSPAWREMGPQPKAIKVAEPKDAADAAIRSYRLRTPAELRVPDLLDLGSAIRQAFAECVPHEDQDTAFQARIAREVIRLMGGE